MKGSLKLFITALVFSFLLPAAALAHKVNIFAYFDAGTVYSESYFPDGRPVAGGQVKVLDSQEKLLVEGVTDAKGQFNFPLPKREDLTLVIQASMGHRNTFLLKKSAIQE